MTDIITREERDELRRLYEAAAQGEWGFREANPPSPGNISVVAWGRHGSYVHVADRPPECSAEEWNANNDLIVAARNALPRLLDTIAAFEQAARVALHKIGQHRAGQYPDGQALEAAAYALSRVLTRSR